MLGSARRHPRSSQRLRCSGRRIETGEDVLGRRRPDPGQELQHPGAGRPVARVLGEAQDREQVLDVRGLEELQPAELHERDVAAGELDLERGAVARRAEEHRLRLQGRAGLPRREDLGADVVGLRGVVADGDELRPHPGAPLGPEVLGEALARLGDDGVGGTEDGLGRAVVLLEGDDVRPRLEVPGEVEDVAHLRRPEAVDRLGVVADDGQATPVGLQPQQDLRLQPVGVLILVDEHMVEAGAECGGRRRVGEHLRPVEQQVVEIEHLGRLLGLDVAGEERLQLGGPADAPGEAALEQRLELLAAVHRPRIDRKAGPLAGEPALGLREPELVPDAVHQVGGVAAVVHGEGGVEAERRGMFAQDADADAVEGAGPGKAGDHRGRRRAEDLAGDALDAPDHLLRRLPGEGHQQHPPRVGAREDQMRHTVRQRAGLAGARTRDDQQRTRDLAVAMQHGAALGFVQPVEIAGGGTGRGAIMFMARS